MQIKETTKCKRQCIKKAEEKETSFANEQATKMPIEAFNEK